MAHVSAVCVVHTLLPEPGNPDGTTAIDKRAVPGPVEVGVLGRAGDSQQDRAHHGGEEYAVYLYADEDARAWADQLGRQIPPGLFGENLRTSGLDVSGLEVEVTSPRNPCATFARRMGEPHWVKRFARGRAPGAYVRVLRVGTVAAGDPVEEVSAPAHGITVADVMGPGPARCRSRAAGRGEGRPGGPGRAHARRRDEAAAPHLTGRSRTT